jgi:hypothetical protein
VGASERDEVLRAAWRALVGGSLDARRFVFVDEMGTNTSLCILYGWARRGHRAYFQVPRNWGLTSPCSLEAVMNLLRNSLLIRKTGDRRRSELTEKFAFLCGFSAEFITRSSSLS